MCQSLGLSLNQSVSPFPFFSLCLSFYTFGVASVPAATDADAPDGATDPNGGPGGVVLSMKYVCSI